MAQVTITLDIDDADLSSGWEGDSTEFALSVEATLNELIGDDGGAYTPKVRTITVDGNDGLDVVDLATIK